MGITSLQEGEKYDHQKSSRVRSVFRLSFRSRLISWLSLIRIVTQAADLPRLDPVRQHLRRLTTTLSSGRRSSAPTTFHQRPHIILRFLPPPPHDPRATTVFNFTDLTKTLPVPQGDLVARLGRTRRPDGSTRSEGSGGCSCRGRRRK